MSRSILIIDDDERLTSVLKRRFTATSRYNVSTYPKPSDALQDNGTDIYAIFLDMMMGNELGIDYIEALVARFHPTHLIIMTGYASIASTVSAMKRGATDYLAKPANFNELLEKLEGTETPLPQEHVVKPLTPAQVEWEHIQRVLSEHDGNISRTAEALGMHRRSLQRKLQKHSPTKH